MFSYYCYDIRLNDFDHLIPMGSFDCVAPLGPFNEEKALNSNRLTDTLTARDNCFHYFMMSFCDTVIVVLRVLRSIQT